MQQEDVCSALARLHCSPQASEDPCVATTKCPPKRESKGRGVSFLLSQPVKWHLTIFKLPYEARSLPSVNLITQDYESPSAL